MSVARQKQSLRQRKREECHDNILRVAESIFKREGFAAARMSDIAAAANISDKTLFNYFPTKVDLLQELTLRWFRRNGPWLEEPEAIAQASVEEVLPPSLDRRLSLVDEDRWLLEQTVAFTDLFVTHRQTVPLIRRNFAARVKRVRQLQKAGAVRNDIPAEEVCDLYHALRDHVIGAWLKTPGADGRTLRRRYHRAMAVFLRGLAPQQTAPLGGGSPV